MTVLLSLGIFYTIYGIFGIFGKGFVKDKYKGYEWTKDYIKKQGISYLLIGIPWLILYFAFTQYRPGLVWEVLLIILLSVPAVVYSIFYEVKYFRLLKKQ